MKTKEYLRWTINIVLLFLFAPTLLAQPSLFFTENEIKLIHQNMAFTHKLDKSYDLYLSSIVYVDEAHWTLWLNNQIIHATDPQQLEHFQIKRVTAFQVEFSWLPSHSTIPLRFTLRPHQIYRGRENRVIRN
jgi:hypothetical protein